MTAKKTAPAAFLPRQNEQKSTQHLSARSKRHSTRETPACFLPFAPLCLSPSLAWLCLLLPPFRCCRIQTGLKAVDELSEQLLLDVSNRVT